MSLTKVGFLRFLAALEVLEGAGGFEKRREASKHVHQIARKVDLMVPSYDQKTKR